MNSKRRAELQRKLSMGAVPRPPADLAERIKAEIPKYLDAHQAPQRFAWSNTFRVAASIMLLLTTALVTRELLEPRRAEKASSVAQTEGVTPAVLRDLQNTTAAETAELSVDITQELPLPTPTAPVATAVARREEAAGVAAGAALDSAVESRRARSSANVAAVEAREEPMLMAQAAPPPAPPPPPAAVAPPSAPAHDAGAALEAAELSAAEFVTVTAASAPTVAQQRSAEKVASDADVFGISVDPRAFRDVRTAIETGSRPSPAAVNVEALVNYFAGAKAPRRDVALEVEASPAPIAADGDRAILRFSVDTSTVAASMRGVVPPVGRDARLHIEIDPRAVATFRRIGDGDTNESEDALLHNTSVTGLYELELKPNLRSSQRVATVTLRYTSAKTGRQQSIARVISGHDLARTWDQASRRHRLAALGAVWSETLKSTSSDPEVAKRAEELATQHPRDSRARELANAVSASFGGG
ncbi:MAG TPA: von Willebrand factor type A domain-containing protein [Thermoanaerobaculia bacterium]|jgi:hypothetical protein